MSKLNDDSILDEGLRERLDMCTCIAYCISTSPSDRQATQSQLQARQKGDMRSLRLYLACQVAVADLIRGPALSLLDHTTLKLHGPNIAFVAVQNVHVAPDCRWTFLCEARNLKGRGAQVQGSVQQ